MRKLRANIKQCKVRKEAAEKDLTSSQKDAEDAKKVTKKAQDKVALLEQALKLAKDALQKAKADELKAKTVLKLRQRELKDASEYKNKCEKSLNDEANLLAMAIAEIKKKLAELESVIKTD